ncbi:MAG: hypothetical protein E7552_00015 [Ruminococcaceae bacterium]|nr:hypothetical protein [Oscillospiraceae bacterium]
MARERYLIGVDTQKLQEERAPERPLTFREKVEKFWYNYQWAVIIVGVIVALIVAAAVLVGSREKVDYTLVMVTKGKLAQTALDELAEEMELYGQDIDKNGKVNVRIVPLVMTDDGDYVELATLFSSGSNVMFAMEPTYYRSQIEQYEEGDEYYFTPLNAKHAGLAEHKRYWNWQNSYFQQNCSGTFPKEMYFGVRAPIGTAAGREEESAACVALLEEFIQNNPMQEITVESETTEIE